MPFRFTVLASGSSGNASLLERNEFGVLLDAGLSVRQLDARLNLVGTGWTPIRAALLTHTHSDHWNDQSFTALLQRRVTLYCHPEHVPQLAEASAVFRQLQWAGLVRHYATTGRFCLSPGFECAPVKLRHDSGATFGFRFSAAADETHAAADLAYAADLGTWDDRVAQAFSDVDVLALEFNHDVALQRASGRAARLIERVLGNEGHLSNEQAAALLQETLRLSRSARLRHVVQLHLSRECNRPDLAVQAARAATARVGQSIAVHTASAAVPTATIEVGRPLDELAIGPVPLVARNAEG